MPLISLLHPSRSRAQKSFNTAKKWIEKAGCDVELIVTLDNNDPSRFEYTRLYQYENALVISSDNTCVVQATNRAAIEAKGDILLYLSDDFDCFDNWGIAVQKEFEGVTEPKLIKVDDMLQPFHVAVLTIPIMNRELYERLGYFWYPEYMSMFVDEDLYWVARKLGALKMCPHLKFHHQHVSIGKAENDDTYKRSSANWDQGKQLFSRRKAMGFPI